MLRFSLLYVATIFVGCGGSDQPAKYPVSGTITFRDGTPVKDISVKFRATDQTSSFTTSGKSDNQGKFQFSAPEGEYAAIVVPSFPRDTDAMTPAERYRVMNPIDPMFLDYEKSPLKFNVSSDPARNNFAIKVWPPPR